MGRAPRTNRHNSSDGKSAAAPLIVYPFRRVRRDWSREATLERIAEESAKRSEVIRQRVLDVLDIDGDPDVPIRIELGTILRLSKAVRAIEDLRQAGYYEQGNSMH